MESNDIFANITCLVYSYDGTGNLIFNNTPYVRGQIWFQVNFDFILTWVDSQFPLSPSPNSWIIRDERQSKLRINLG